MINAYLYLDGKKYRLLHLFFNFNQSLGVNNKPSSIPRGGQLQLTVPAIDKDLELLNWTIHSTMQKKGRIEIMARDGGSMGFKMEFANAYATSATYIYDSNSSDPMNYTITITAGILRINGDNSTIHKQTWDDGTAFDPPTPVTVIEENTPQITNIQWINTDTKEQDIKSIGYKENASLQAVIQNPEGSTATITIEKEDGTEFANGETTLSFTEAITEEGIVELTPMEIKEQWEEFKTSDIDKLIAKVEHGAVLKKSNTLQIKPSPQVIVNFRPHTAYKGEYGFDWLRTGDTSLFGDNNYETIVSKQYSDAAFTKLEKDGNECNGHFKKDPKLFEKLKKTYDHFIFPWSSPNTSTTSNFDDYFVPWLSLLKDKEAKVELIIDIKQEADFIEFEANEHFQITPSKIDIKGLKGVQKKDSKGKTFNVVVKCIKEFTADEEIVINSYHLDIMGQPKNLVLAGKIKAWANDATKQKEKEVVFVQIKTPEIRKGYGVKTGNAKLEKTRINNYLNQAFIKLHPNSKIITLDVSNDKDFKKFVKGTSINYTNLKDKEQLHDFIKKKLKKDFKGVYTNAFKAFYFAEKGGATGGLSGYSVQGSDFVVVFSSANDQTASHEFLHAFNLAHSFTNSEADSNAEYTYQYKQTDNLLDYSHHVSGHKNSRTSLWYWQWKKANNSIKKL